MAIEQAHRILDWHENLGEEELPPEWMWPLEDELSTWFDEVKRKREEKYGSSSSEDKTVPMTENEFAKGRR